jgi:tetratricopeptide (TPR) repeat protein
LGDYHNSIKFSEKVLTISREIGDRRSEEIGLVILALTLDEIGQRNQAIDFTKKALKIFEHIESPNVEKALRKLAK